MNKVLFIEDDTATLKIYKERFSRLFDVILAPTGKEGVDFAVSKSPDVIILDIILGGELDGYDVLKQIKSHPESKNIPVIVLTNLESQEKIAQKTGAIECFVKANISISKVEEIIQKYLAKA